MLISSLKLICLLLQIFQRTDNVFSKHRKYSINRNDRIIGGRPANKGIEIQITNQIDITYLFEFKFTHYF